MKLERETEFIEFKESLSQLSRAIESLIAMINKHGKGVIYFGVQDNGEIIGVNLGNKTQKDISEAVYQKVKPTIIPHISEETFGDKTILKLEASGTNTPYSSDGNYFIRSGNENRKIDPETMRLLIFKNSNDNMVDIESLNQDLTFNSLYQLYLLHNYSVDKETFNKNVGLLTKDNKYNLLADLLSDYNNYSIKVVRFKGMDKSELISRDEFGYQNMLLAMEKALDFVLTFNETRVQIIGATRKEIKLFDENSLREAWINACLHTRWDKQIPPAIYIFADRIEIISIGGLPIDYDKEDFYKGISHPINKRLQKIMGQLDYVEQTGHGVPEILKHYDKDAFIINENYINVVLKFPFNLTRGALNYSKFTSSQALVLNAINLKPSITINDLTRVTNLKSSRITQILKELKDLNVLIRCGSNKNGYWKINL